MWKKLLRPFGKYTQAADITERLLSENEIHTHSQVLLSMSEAVSFIDSDHRILFTNPSFNVMFRYRAGELIGQHITILNAASPEENGRIASEIHSSIAQTGYWEGEFQNIRKDGTRFYTKARITALEGITGIAYISVQEDITQRKATEDALRASEARLSLIFNLRPDIKALLRVEADNSFVFEVVNQAFRSLIHRAFPYSPRVITGKELIAFLRECRVPEDDIVFEVASYQNLIKTSKPIAYDDRMTSSAVPMVLEVTKVPILDAERQCTHILFSARDVTSARQAQEALHQSEARLHNLSQRLIQAQEDERRHIGRELHDQIGQLLTGLRLSIGALERKPVDELPEAILAPQQIIDDVIRQLRALTHSLHPSILDNLGLGPALEQLFNQYERQTGIRVNWTQEGLVPPCPFPPDVRIAAYRIVQEALTNVARYAGVEEANAETVFSENRLHIVISDSGRGFASSAVLASNEGMGLVGIRERVNALEGELYIKSEPGQGTIIQVTLSCG